MSTYSVLAFFTRTGAVVDQLPFTGWPAFSTGCSWSDSDTMSVEVPLTGRRAANRQQLETVRSIERAAWTLSLCLVQDQRALWAGPATAVGFDDESLTIGCSSIKALYDRRVLIAPGHHATPMDGAGDIHLELTTADLVLELLELATTGTGRDLPIDIPVQSGMTGSSAVDYLAADLKTAGEAIKEAAERDDGPDVMLRPVLSLDQDQVRWTADVGAPRLGSAESVAVFDYPGAIKSLSGDADASECVSTAYVLGDSTGAEDAPRLIGVYATDRGLPHPALERADRTSVSTAQLEVLDSLAASYGAAYATPVREWKVTVHRDHRPLYREEWQEGDVVTLAIAGHPYLADGEYLQRVVGVSGGEDDITLATQAAP